MATSAEATEAAREGDTAAAAAPGFNMQARAKKPEARRAHRLMANAVYNLIPQVWFLGLTVFTTPFVLHRLGVEAYGVLSIITVVAGYLAFLDLGLNIAVIRFIAAHDAKGERQKIARVTATALFIFSAMALLTAAALLAAGHSLARLLNVPEPMQPAAAQALQLGGISFGLNLILGVFSAVPRALQRFDIVNALNIIIGTLQIGITVLLLACGMGLLALMIWSCVLSGLSLAVYAITAKRLLPFIRLWPRFDRETFRDLFGFSGFVMASNFTGVAASNSEKLLLGGLAPIAQVTYYAVPFNLISRVLTLVPSNMFAVLFPAFSAMTVTDDREAIRRAYVRAFRMVFLAVAPVTILLMAFGADLLRLWIDAEMASNGGPVLMVLAVALLINGPAWVTVTVGQSLGRPGVVAAAQVIHLGALILFGLWLVPLYGAFGAAVAWLAGNLIGVPVLLTLVNRQTLGMRTPAMLRAAAMRPLLVTLSALLLAFALKPLVHGFISLIGAALIVVGFYAALAYWQALTSIDRGVIKTFVMGRGAALFSAVKTANGVE
jgi:O-antigen/teichoic acid export membrane protein